nr:putative protein phosphatase 2c 51 [Quercus suber]
MNLQRTTSDSREMSQITVTRRRIKVRRLKYTCGTKKTSSSSSEDVGDSVKVSLSVSSSEKEEVVLSYGSVSVIGRRREMEDAVRAELGIMNKKGGGGIFSECTMGMEGATWRGLVVKGCFAKMDEEVVGGSGGVGRTVGSTAVVAVVGEEELVVANCEQWWEGTTTHM